jgi:hypothetical protein
MASDFKQLQKDFAAYIRNPKQTHVPAGVEAQRMATYCELFYNNVQSLLAATYPVLRQLLPDTQWHALIKNYFATHRATTPLFPQMPREFLTYLAQARATQTDDPPFLYELAHYEWVELAIAIDEREIDLLEIETQTDLLDACPIVNPLAWLLVYRYPVHRLSPHYQPLEPPAEPTYIVIYRDLNDKVGFVQLNPVSAYLFTKLSDGKTGRQILEEVAAALQHPQPVAIIQSGLEMMHAWHTRNIILGTRL